MTSFSSDRDRNRRRRRRSQQGFSLLESALTMVMAAVILAMAVPSLSKSRSRADAQTCVSNLLQIDSARRQWALDKRKSDTDTVTIATDLVNPAKYLSSVPVCPNGGTYTATTVSTAITCSLGTRNDTDPSNDHVLP